MIIKKYRIPVYQDIGLLIIFENWYETIDYLESLGLDVAEYRKCDLDGLQLAQTLKKKRWFITLIKKGKNLEYSFIHELYHLTQYIMDNAEVDYKKGGTNEAYAYLHETLYKMLIKFVRKNIK